MPEGLLDEPAHRDTAQGIEGTDQVRRSGVDGVNAAVALQIRDRPTLNGDGLHRNLVGHNDRNDDVTWALRAENGILGETILPGREYLAEVIDAVAIGVTLGFIEQTLVDAVIGAAYLVAGQGVYHERLAVWVGLAN